tara:strand:+ start:2039 stop:2638 length:600 start_codon:yes stop_codon:yes gene_type:complete
MNLEKLESWLEAGGGVIGQINVAPEDEGYTLKHVDDQMVEGLSVYQIWEDAHEICKFNSAGEFRPLKSSSDLRTGWLMKLGSVGDVLAALDVFYPAAIGMWTKEEFGKLRVTPMMETLQRQTGMYRFAQTISESGKEKIIQERCRKSCLRRILWKEGAGAQPGESAEREIPIYCPEICNLLVADARKVVREEHQALHNS